MVLLLILMVVAVMVLSAYRYVAMKPASIAWQSSIKLGFAVGVLRALFACMGWYTVEHTGGPIQIPAFLFVIFAWPEAAVFGRQTGVAPLSFYPALALLLIGSSVVLMIGIVLIVQATRDTPRN